MAANDITASADEKARLRAECLSRRDQLPLEDRIERSLLAADVGFEPLMAAFGLHPGMVVSGYMPIRSEFDPRPLMDLFRINRMQLCLPAVLDKQTIVFRELHRTNELVDTGFGTKGPPETAAVVDPEVMLVPLAAFDPVGNRIGYGAGHYDRAIAKLYQRAIYPVLIGLAFECQQVERIPAEAHDRPLGAVITEKGFRRFESA